jgi:hypothetical protein
MAQNLGFIKLQRSLLNSFSDDKKLNSELWLLYHYLVQIAAYDDMREVCRGQIKTKTIQIIQDFFPHWYAKKMLRRLHELQNLGFIKITVLDEYKQSQYLIDICQYDNLYGKSDEKSCPISVSQVSDKCLIENNDNHQESLGNYHAKKTSCPISVSKVSDKCLSPPCSYYIEERKEELRIKNNLDEGVNPSPKVDEQIIKVDKKKTKQKGKSKPVINAYQEAYLERYNVEALITPKVRTQACFIADQIPAEEIKDFIRFYLSHNDPFYLKKAHKLGLCLADIETIYTEFQKNGYITKEYVESFSRPKNLSRFRI